MIIYSHYKNLFRFILFRTILETINYHLRHKLILLILLKSQSSPCSLKLILLLGLFSFFLFFFLVAPSPCKISCCVFNFSKFKEKKKDMYIYMCIYAYIYMPPENSPIHYRSHSMKSGVCNCGDIIWRYPHIYIGYSYGYNS